MKLEFTPEQQQIILRAINLICETMEINKIPPSVGVTACINVALRSLTELGLERRYIELVTAAFDAAAASLGGAADYIEVIDEEPC